MGQASPLKNDADLLRHNIAQMYQYYNQLIFRQGSTQNKYKQPNLVKSYSDGHQQYRQRHQDSIGAHRTANYEFDHFSRVMGQSEDDIYRSQQDASAVSVNVNNTTTREADRSRSRSAARTASENLLVSLDESILPP